MKALVTGSRGFLGTRLCGSLRMQGVEVLEHDILEGDLSHPDALDAFPPCDVVYHLAARTFVPDSWALPHEFFRVNVMGTVTALEFCKKHHARFIQMSTYVYGEPQCLPIPETHPVNPTSPYHESKVLCESLGLFYHNQHGIDVFIIRPFNIYGPGQSIAFLLPKIMEQVMDTSRREIEVFDLSPKRDYVYVDDVVHALCSVLTCEGGYHVFNIGTGYSHSIEEVIQTVLAVCAVNKPYHSLQSARKNEIADCYADITNASRVLGFSPAYTLEQGIAQWIKELMEKKEHCGKHI